jgi:glycosyltransferase involved in cell wall biosynthesis
MKIVYYCADRGVPVLGHKGASVHVREFVTALACQGHQIVLLCARMGSGNDSPPAWVIELPHLKNHEATLAEAATLGVTGIEDDQVLYREVEKLANDRQLAGRALDALRQLNFQPDVIYERYSLFHRSGNQLANTLGVPRIVEMNAPLVEEQERFRGLRLKNIAEEFSAESLCGAAHIVAVSDAVKEAAINTGVPSERISVIANGVDTRRFQHKSSQEQNCLVHGLGKRPVIGFIGSLKPWHGLDFLLDAFQQIRAARPDAALMIVGDGPGMAGLQKRVATQNLEQDVILVGHVPHADIPGYLAAMDLTVAPYDAQEHFYFSPLKVVESLAAGRPVVAPEIGQLPDLIQNGVTGLLYPPGDAETFAAHVIELLENPQRRIRMGRKAASIAADEFSWNRIARRVTVLMTQLSQQEVA